MVAFNFEKRFAAEVEKGNKTQTIRRWPQRCFKGDEVQLYTGQRTKACRKLADSVCTAVFPVRFNPNFFAFNNLSLDAESKFRIARADGFKDYDHMMKFFFPYGDSDDTPDFVGYLYEWKRPKGDRKK